MIYSLIIIPPAPLNPYKRYLGGDVFHYNPVSFAFERWLSSWHQPYKIFNHEKHSL